MMALVACCRHRLSTTASPVVSRSCVGPCAGADWSAAVIRFPPSARLTPASPILYLEDSNSEARANPEKSLPSGGFLLAGFSPEFATMRQRPERLVSTGGWPFCRRTQLDRAFV